MTLNELSDLLQEENGFILTGDEVVPFDIQDKVTEGGTALLEGLSDVDHTKDILIGRQHTAQEPEMVPADLVLSEYSPMLLIRGSSGKLKILPRRYLGRRRRAITIDI